MTFFHFLVDGGAWRMGSVGTADSEWRYPDFLLSEKEVTGVKGRKKKKEEEEGKSKLWDLEVFALSPASGTEVDE